MARKHRHKKHEEHVDESWLVPYADILTLLLALFIVLFATSSADQAKMQELSEVFSEIFDGGKGMVDKEAIIDFGEGEAGNEDAKEPLTDIAQKYINDQIELQKIEEKVENIIAAYNLDGQFETKMTDEGLLITIRDNLLFELGSAEVSEEYKDVIKELSRIMSFKPERNVLVMGHTDTLSLNNEVFKSNWELSLMRSTNFLKMMAFYNPEMNVRYFSAKGLGEVKPVASNNTEEGRAQNRRVEILIQPNVAKDEVENAEKIAE